MRPTAYAIGTDVPHVASVSPAATAGSGASGTIGCGDDVGGMAEVKDAAKPVAWTEESDAPLRSFRCCKFMEV